MNSPKARGGIARAQRLTPDQRTEIARKAANARWDEEGALPRVICGSPDRPLRIADREIPCYVLEDGTRVLSQAGFLQALGRHPKASTRREEEELQNGVVVAVPPLLQGQTIRPFISDEVLSKSHPVTFRLPNGVRASGYRAELLPEVCEVYLKARDEDALLRSQKHIAREAEILIRAFAHVGIIALVDEATGYQEMRAKDALARILDTFIAKELQAWLRTFPDAFYYEMFRLRGLEFPRDSIKRPQYFGILTNDIVYRRLAPGVLDELRRVTPKNESGHRSHRYFQRLTSNVGYPKLREHLGSVVTLMKLSDTWADFIEKLDRIHPRYDQTLPLPLYEQDDGRGL